MRHQPTEHPVPACPLCGQCDAVVVAGIGAWCGMCAVYAELRSMPPRPAPPAVDAQIYVAWLIDREGVC